MHAPATLSPPTPRFLMCPAQHFAVSYRINPWMDPANWRASSGALAATAQRQWAGLHSALIAHGATVETLDPAPGLPDLVFTANAAVVLDGKALLARFRHLEREAEEPLFKQAFKRLRERGLLDEVCELPAGMTLEGAGDCLWDAHRQLFWLGSGFRSDGSASAAVADVFGAECVSLTLTDPRFYHLDTAFCALPCGAVIYYPAAFVPTSRERIEAIVPASDRIAIEETDAECFAANAVAFGRTIVLSRASKSLRGELEARGYCVVETLLDAFQRSGGSACCLTLRLDHGHACAQDIAPHFTAGQPPATDENDHGLAALDRLCRI